MTNRAKVELKEFRRELRAEGSGVVNPRSHQRDSKRRKKIKKERAKERKKKVEEGPEARIAPGPPDVNQEGGVGPKEKSTELREGQRGVRFREGPKAASTEIHVYDPVSISYYTRTGGWIWPTPTVWP